MPKRDSFFADLAAPHRHAALLIAQVGAMPTEIQLVLQVAEYDETKSGLRPLRSYIVRVLGAEEHRIANLGVTVTHPVLTTDHPLLLQYNDKPAALFFRGKPTDVHALTLDIAQTHALTFKGWREFPSYLNVEQPLATLLASGGGLLGQMPLTLATRLEPVLQAHGLETKCMTGDTHQPSSDSPMKGQQMTAFVFGESYVLSYAFSFDEFTGKL